MIYDFVQMDVFTTTATRGNPVAVVHGADTLTDDQMAAFARWTNLSETTFLLRPTDPAADYRLRIFTPGGELPFAGHPTLGSARAWLDAGGAPMGEHLVQECGIGLVTIRREPDTGRLAFAAPPLLRSGPVDDATMATVLAGLRLTADQVVAANWVCNGPQWLGILLGDGQEVLDVVPDFPALNSLEVGLIAPWTAAEAVERGADYEVRAFVPGLGVPEDPVTGSLNAGLAVWLRDADVAAASYVAAQGTVMQRSGRVHVVDDGDRIWVGGSAIAVVSGKVDL